MSQSPDLNPTEKYRAEFDLRLKFNECSRWLPKAKRSLLLTYNVEDTKYRNTIEWASVSKLLSQLTCLNDTRTLVLLPNIVPLCFEVVNSDSWWELGFMVIGKWKLNLIQLQFSYIWPVRSNTILRSPFYYLHKGNYIRGSALHTERHAPSSYHPSTLCRYQQKSQMRG